MTPDDLYERFIDRLDATDARKRWNDGCGDAAWTPIMTNALCGAVRDLLPKGATIAAKDSRDEYGRSEYLSLDVIGLVDPPEGWASPSIVIEHENRRDEEKVKYCAWKLFCVRSELRVLVAYFHSAKSSRPQLEKAVKEVADRHPGLPLMLISGEINDEAVRNWRETFRRKLFNVVNASLGNDARAR